ncbi:MAG: hypothetical protein QOD99_1312 [Chthoniobacter sp.]|nr:hypothetical protein [Chthoniobacter sp.]
MSDAPPAAAVKAPAEIWKSFDGDKAFQHVEALVNLGARPAGSVELEKARGHISAALKESGWKVEAQNFNNETPRGTVTFTNLIARFGGSTKTQRAIVCSHYDTKIFDTIRFVGASDGGSSTGALIELARVLALDPDLAKKVELVFFDGEEAVAQFTAEDGLYGSRFYARQLRESGRVKQFEFGILWDMIGDKNLTITLSPDSPGELARGILEAAIALHERPCFSYYSRDIYDDHVPLNAAHIPTIDLIDFDYPPWHTADDTLDKLSPQSLQKVGAVTLFYLHKHL